LQGLSIAQLIVRLLDSEIEVASPWNPTGAPGTRFSFTVNGVQFCTPSTVIKPHLSTDTAPTDTPPTGQVQMLQPGALSVLIVEDDKLNCMIMGTCCR
jgi:hypothetical protein